MQLPSVSPTSTTIEASPSTQVVEEATTHALPHAAPSLRTLASAPSFGLPITSTALSLLGNLFKVAASPRPLRMPDLPPTSMHSDDAYTLVLDLDETLLHTQWLKNSPESYVVHERPYAREFLRALQHLPMEVIVFTAGIQGYADAVINVLDHETQTIQHRLYRQHTTASGYQRWKDLSLLNRDLNRTLIVDNSPDAFLKHPDNGLVISSWDGHLRTTSPLLASSSHVAQFLTVEDCALVNLFYWLEYLCITKLPVHVFIRKYRKALREAVGYGSYSRAPRDYRPPFPMGPASIELLSRCYFSLTPDSDYPVNTVHYNTYSGLRDVPEHAMFHSSSLSSTMSQTTPGNVSFSLPSSNTFLGGATTDGQYQNASGRISEAVSGV